MASLQAGLLENAVLRGQRQILLRMRYRHLAGLGGVLELLMRANRMHQAPAVGLESFDEGCAVHAVHCGFYTRLHKPAVGAGWVLKVPPVHRGSFP